MGSINAKQMREWLHKNPTGRLRDLYVAFDDVHIREINKAMNYLARRGELNVGDEYIYLPNIDDRLTAAQDKVWRAIRSQAKQARFVEVDEIAILSGVSRDYCRKYMRWLGLRGYLVQRPNGRFGVLDKAIKKARTPYWAGIKSGKQEMDHVDGNPEA